MAKGKKTGGRNFPKGVSGNPKGSAGLPQDLKDARRLNKIELERTLNLFLYSTDNERADVLKDPKAPALEKLAAMILDLAIKNGDQVRFEFILNRLLGKVKDEVEVTTLEPFVIEKLNGDTVAIGAKLASP